MTWPRLYPILDTSVLASRGFSALGFAQAVLAGGAQVLQYRHKGEYTRERFAEAEEIGKLVREAGARYVINDRADVAALLGADLHLGQDDLPPGRARAIVGTKTAIGFSTHNEQQFLAGSAEPVDYVALGPIYATTSKERPDPVVGLEVLRACRRIAVKPLIAIGGITEETAELVLRAGADSLALIRPLLPLGATTSDVRGLVEAWRRLTD